MPTLREVVSRVQEARKGFMSKTIYSIGSGSGHGDPVRGGNVETALARRTTEGKGMV